MLERLGSRAPRPFYSMPPEDLRLYDPTREGKLETPLDERGLVDLDELVKTVKSTVDPTFTWASEFNDVHHLQWYASRYPVDDGSDISKKEFRELVNRKAYVPRAFHNWAHAVTLPPRIPSEEVMQYSIDAQRVAMSLAKTASLAVRLTRMAGIPAQRLNERIDSEFINYNLFVENARLIPPEFRRVPVEQVEAKTHEDLFAVNRKLGRLALDRIPIRLRAARI